ncbi:MAG: agmatine deiminase family protein, partial [Gammaproteobacteria bacterium]|nr:agmatine deiminase family protein [Gammaproteobacteria bacterium]
MVDGQARFPAEWEPQSAILLAWPHADTDWAERLGEVEDSYVELVAAIARFQPAIVCVADADVEAYARARLASARIDMDRVKFVEVEYDDTWLRDTGPITLRGSGGFHMLDFRFTGWGGKFGADRDDRLGGQLHEAGSFSNNPVQDIDFALEGGAIETDGAGTLLSTQHCLRERHPDLGREELESRLGAWLHQDRFLWLERGYLEGDDTDA